MRYMFIFAALFSALVFTGCGERALFNFVGTQKIDDHLYVGQTQIANFYVFRDGTNAVMIDSGYLPMLVLKQIQKLGIDPYSVTHIFLTTSDYDHTGGVRIFSNAMPYISVDEEQMINGKKARNGFDYFNQKFSTSYRLLKDGEAMEVGKIKIEAIATPGHTLGSMSYLVDDSYLFTGDTIALVNGLVLPFFNKFNMKTPVVKESIKKLASNPELKRVKMILTAHTGFTTNVLESMKGWME